MLCFQPSAFQSFPDFDSDLPNMVQTFNFYYFLDEAKGNDAVKKSIREKCLGYINRAEEIKKFLEKKNSKGSSGKDKKPKANKAEGS